MKTLLPDRAVLIYFLFIIYYNPHNAISVSPCVLLSLAPTCTRAHAHSLRSNADAVPGGEGTPQQETNQPMPYVFKRNEPHNVVTDDILFKIMLKV